ncbi:MAG: hypothetical protein V3V02_03315 [Rhizobiaceae bacterium]
MKDPASVKFGKIYAVKNADSSSVVHVCGSLNAKNSYGGYVGEQSFVSFVIIDENGPPKVPGPFIELGATKSFATNCLTDIKKSKDDALVRSNLEILEQISRQQSPSE